MPGRFNAAVAGLIILSFASPSLAQYRTHAQIGQFLLDAQTNYPTLAVRQNLGYSVLGRELWAIRISDNVGIEEDEPEFNYISTMHGDEIIGVEMCLYLIDELLTNYGTDPQITNLVDQVEIWILPLANPDGYERSPRTRYNDNGFDLNRSFPEGSGPNPDANSTAGRQAEVAVLMDWAFAHSFTLAANFHGGALVANYPFDNDNKGSVNSPTPYDNMFIYISEEYSQYNLPMWNSSSFFHGITNGADWYAIDGGRQDWSYRYMGGNEITIELGNTKQPPASQIPTYWSQNRDSMLAYMDTCLIGVRGLVTDVDSGLPLAATVRVVGRDHDIYTDPDVGDYHRMAMPGTYDLEVEVDGYANAFNNVVVNSGPATRLDVQVGGPAKVAAPDGGEMLPAGVETDVTWTGNSAAQFQVQYTDNFGDAGFTTDGFESRSLGPEYTTGGSQDWYVTSTDAHSGLWSARAGGITHNQTTWLTRSAGGGTVSFWYRVSSESGWDFFNFYIDGSPEISASGNGSWTYYATTLSAGTHELRWEYTKDSNTSNYSDTAFIDDLEINTDNTTWTDIIALTGTGVTSTPWTPTVESVDYKVRVRAYYPGGIYGEWDESDNEFEVSAGPGGDWEPDGDVDLADAAAFQRCFESSSSECRTAFDFDVSTIIGLPDHQTFATYMTGPGGP